MSEESRKYDLPLTGVRVLAAEHHRMGPMGSKLLADAGAEVIKIEPPGTGEHGRRIILRTGGKKRLTYIITSLSHNKKSVTLNLKNEKGKDLFKQLVKVSDVVWENMRPGVMDHLGLGYAALREVNPAIIYVALSGFGHRDIYASPYSERLAVEPVIQAMSGLMFMGGKEGDLPVYIAGALSDTVSGMLGAYGALLALQRRQRTGLGQFVDISMYDVMVAVNNYAVSFYSHTGSKPSRGEQFLEGAEGIYKAKDGPVMVAASNSSEDMWRRICNAIGRADLIEHPELRDAPGRARNTESIIHPAMGSWIADKTVDEVVKLLSVVGVPAAPIQDVQDILACPHLRARNMLVEVEDPVVGKVTEVGNPIKLLGVPELPPGVPPQLGQHNEEILGRLLSLTSSELEELKAAGVI